MEPDCIFCQIIAGDAPSTMVAENDRAIAFMDIKPITPGHTLVIPRSHAVDALDIDSDDLAACAQLAQLIAQRAKTRLDADGINLLNCTGEAAWQTVFHFHLHVIPRYANDESKDRVGQPWAYAPSTPDQIKQLGALLA